MSLEPGTRIADRYEIRSLLGAGGMGEVYLASDAELKRTVALKFLPAEVAADPKRLERFEREALSASALNHPNILTVHDIGRTEDGRRFFATEFVKGRTLREHVKARRLKLGEVLDLATQIASALVEAHAHGIVHRDIKPENVMVRDDGYVKVLDFGLAKLVGNPAAGGVDTEAATQALAVTDAGAVMGTVAYMSPEQAAGRVEVDARTDVWSLGVVLYEMLTGHLPFRGRSAHHIIVAIQDEEPPPLAAHTAGPSELLQEVVSDALAKDRDARPTAKQMFARLQRLKRRLDVGGTLDHSVVPNVSAASGEAAGRATGAEHGTTAGGARHGSTQSGAHATVAAAVTDAGETRTTAAGVGAGARRRKWLVPALALSAVALAGAGFGLYKFSAGRRSASGPPVAPLQQMKFTRVPVSGDVGWAFISPDGRFIARIVNERSKSSLRLRQVAGPAEREVVPPADSYFHGGVTFSPDGNSIYYAAGEANKNFRRVYRVSVLGGDPQKLIDGADSAVAVSPDGRRLAFRRHQPQTREDQLVVANEDGTGEQVVATRHQPAQFSKPEWSPDGQLLAHPIFSRDDEGEYALIEATALSDRSTKTISQARWRYITTIEWLPDGEGLVVTGKTRSAPVEDRGQIWYVPFGEGEPQKISNDANHYWGLTLTADARTALVMQTDISSNVWVAPAGDSARARQITNSNIEIGELCWTPDGRIVYASAAAGGRYLDLWVMNPDGTGNRQLTFTADRHEHFPSLSHDGRHVVFQTMSQTGLRSIWRMGMDGGGAKELARNIGQYASPQVSPDSRWVFYNARDEAGAPAFWKVPFDGGEPVKVREKTSCHPSPDGKWFVCAQDAPGPDAILKAHVVPAAGGDPVRTLDWPKDANALWLSPDSQALDYIATRDGVPNIWRLHLASGREQRLTDWETNAPLWWFAWSRDGKQLAVTRDTQTTHLVLIQNFR